MVKSFESAMEKMTVLGNELDRLIDCSEVIPVPSTQVDAPHLPAGKTLADIQASCPEVPFPSLSAQPGELTSQRYSHGLENLTNPLIRPPDHHPPCVSIILCH